MSTFLTFEQAVAKLREGYAIKRTDWPCKQLRSWKESDADYFMSEVPRGTIIIQVCDQPCECPIGPYIEESGDRNAEDWVVLYKSV